MTTIMGVINLTPDSFVESSRAGAGDALARIAALAAAGADIVDIGAASSRPGAPSVPLEEEWSRLAPVLSDISRHSRTLFPASSRAISGCRISIDTTSSEIVQRAFDTIGPFIVNDISAGEDDPGMLSTAARLNLPYVAMHKRGTPLTMDSLCNYPDGVMNALLLYFETFSEKAHKAGIDNWILDPGLGFAKTPEQCLEILEHLELLKKFGRPILVGTADKRFTKLLKGGSSEADSIAVSHGADILRVHHLK